MGKITKMTLLTLSLSLSFPTSVCPVSFCELRERESNSGNESERKKKLNEEKISEEKNADNWRREERFSEGIGRLKAMQEELENLFFDLGLNSTILKSRMEGKGLFFYCSVFCVFRKRKRRGKREKAKRVDNLQGGYTGQSLRFIVHRGARQGD